MMLKMNAQELAIAQTQRWCKGEKEEKMDRDHHIQKTIFDI